MDVSVIVPTYNQRERLRLVLSSLGQQTLTADRFEVVVVDDGSTDGTEETLYRCNCVNLRVLKHSENTGRNRARNMGVEAARGDLIVFLDGDALPAPDLLQRYLEAYQQHGGRAVFCGFQYSLPDLEYFQDPQTGHLIDRRFPSVMQDYITVHLEELVLTEEMLRNDFDAVRSRAREGGYPFAELAERQEQVRFLLDRCPESAVRWLGFIPHNGAMGRILLQEADGFDEQIPFSEGWELAYRLQNFHAAGIHPVSADSYHLYHYHDFTDSEAARQETLKRYRAIEYMAEKHGDTRIRLLYFWYAHFWPDTFIPEEAVVDDLIELDRLYRELPEEIWQEYQIVLNNHPSISILNKVEESYENCCI